MKPGEINELAIVLKNQGKIESLGSKACLLSSTDRK